MRDKISVDLDLVIRTRAKYVTFAKALVFLADSFSRGEAVYTKDLANFLKVTEARARQILRDFENLDLIFPIRVSSIVTEWHPVKNDEHIILEKYLPFAIETLKKAGMWKE